jgi:N-methylhydantoinase A
VTTRTTAHHPTHPIDTTDRGEPVFVAVDIGGTFTDIAVHDPGAGRVSFHKVLSHRSDLVGAVLAGIDSCGAPTDGIELLVHGSTVAINALLERDGADTALVTTAGFRDVYEIGRINRPESFNLAFRKHRPLVPRSRILEVTERVRHDGTVHTPLDEDQARAVARQLREQGVEAVGVVFLHSYADPTHERRMAEILREECGDAVFVTTSAELSREYREFERTSTTAANAYVGPRVSGYLTDLQRRLDARGFAGELMLMQSNGGLYDVATASRQCIQMVESGPAGGVRGTVEVSRRLGLDRTIYFDMGGTTAKTCVVRDGQAELSAQYFVGGYNEGLPVRVPVLDITEIGTGGGSLAWLDEAGGLHVGPRSAGADPGPACYGGGGTLPTVTDAHVVLGHLSPTRFLDGRMALDVEAARRAITEHVAGPLGLDPVTAAQGVLAIANAAMANAVRAVTTERGLDPRDFTLVAAGGAGPMHVVDVAVELGIGRVLVPPAPGTFSALGMLTADLRRDYVRTHFVRFDDVDAPALEALYRELEATGRSDIGGGEVDAERSADIRYVGQEHSVTVAVAGALDTPDALAALKAAFDAEHVLRFGHQAPDEPAELVSLRVSVIGRREALQLTALGAPTGGAGAVVIERRPAALGADTELREVDVADRALMGPGAAVKGPALVEEAGSCLCLPEGAVATCDDAGNLVVEVELL